MVTGGIEGVRETGIEGDGTSRIVNVMRLSSGSNIIVECHASVPLPWLPNSM